MKKKLTSIDMIVLQMLSVVIYIEYEVGIAEAFFTHTCKL